MAGRFPALIGLSINPEITGGRRRCPAGVFGFPAVAAVALDEQQRQTHTLFMKGLTVFAATG